LAKKGVILINLGGPDSLESVEPFLINLFSDPDIFSLPFQGLLARVIAKLRARSTRKYYELMGGKSPQLEQTLRQAEKLQEKLGEDYKVVVGMRYWKPYIEDALKTLLEEGVKSITLLPLYPQYSKTTTGSAFNEFRRVSERYRLEGIEVYKINSFHDHPLYIEAWVERIRESVKKTEEYFFLFSAHSLPKKIVEEGDPYQQHTQETVKRIMEHFPDHRYALAYQSRVGFGEWLEPYTDKLMEKLAKEGVKKLLVIPISFVSEHSETLYELDVQYRELAEKLGIEDYVRVKTLQDSPLFIEALADLVRKSGGKIV